MASLHLTATEHRYYGDIFIYCCENADSDSVPVIKVAELLRSANLPRDVTMKVSSRWRGESDLTLTFPCRLRCAAIEFVSMFENSSRRDDRMDKCGQDG